MYWPLVVAMSNCWLLCILNVDDKWEEKAFAVFHQKVEHCSFSEHLGSNQKPGWFRHNELLHPAATRPTSTWADLPALIMTDCSLRPVIRASGSRTRPLSSAVRLYEERRRLCAAASDTLLQVNAPVRLTSLICGALQGWGSGWCGPFCGCWWFWSCLTPVPGRDIGTRMRRDSEGSDGGTDRVRHVTNISLQGTRGLHQVNDVIWKLWRHQTIFLISLTMFNLVSVIPTKYVNNRDLIGTRFLFFSLTCFQLMMTSENRMMFLMQDCNFSRI